MLICNKEIINKNTVNVYYTFYCANMLPKHSVKYTVVAFR